MSLRETILNQDMFGHQVSINFNRKGDRFNTFSGGILSIMVNLILAIYLFIIVKIMIKRENDTVIVVPEVTNFDEIGDLSFERAAIMPVFAIRESRYYSNINDTDIQRMISFKIAKISRKDNVMSFGQMSIRPCTYDDFKGVEHLLDDLKRGVENSVFCPDDLSQLILQNVVTNMTEMKTFGIEVT